MRIDETQASRYNAAAVSQFKIDGIVKNIIRDPLLLVYYQVFAKEAVKLTKKHKGQTLIDEIDILEQKWNARGLDEFNMDRIKNALNVPIPLHCFYLDESYVDGFDVLCPV